MNVQLTSRHFELTDGIKTHVNDRLDGLKFTDPVHDVHVTMMVEKYRQICEVVVNGDGFTLKTEEESPDMYQSIDAALEKLEKQLKKHHDAYLARRHKAQQAREQEKSDVTLDVEEDDE